MSGMPPETGLRESLFRDIPTYFDRGPAPLPGLTIDYDGTGALASIAQRHLTVTVTGGTGDALVIDLRGHTLTTLVTEINTHTGYTANLTGNTGTIAAIGLVPVQDFDLFFDARLMYFTSTLWCLLMSLVYALEDTMEHVERGARQLYLDTAEGKWVDNWGVYYARVQRRLSEEDRVYAQRIIREVTRWKLNHLALERIVHEETGLYAQVRNLYEEAWEVGGRLGRLAGRRYSRTTFEVIVSDLSDAIVALILKYKAAGTLPFFRFQISQGDVEEGFASITVTVTAQQSLLSRYAWVMGRDRCGELPLGGKHFSLFEIFTFAPHVEAYLDVSAGIAGEPLILGVGTLGDFTLGNVTDAGILLSEGDVFFLEIDATSVVFEDQITGDLYRLTFTDGISIVPIVSGTGESGWEIQTGWYIGIWNGVLELTETPIPDAVAKNVAVDLAVINGVLVYTPPAVEESSGFGESPFGEEPAE